MTAPGSRDFDGAVPETVTGLLAAAELRRDDFVAGRFRIGKLLGIGGMGVVYQARDEQLGVDVALKLLRPELASRPEAFERFRRELLLARQVSSPHVVRIHDLVQHGEVWLLSMDYVAGRSLQQVIDSDGPLAPERALHLTRQLALGLAAAHHRGVVHRDLKPANVLVTEADEALITDFGVAHSAGATGLTLSGVIVGTPEYLSPEQARAEPVDARSDLYALGLILHEMLTGKVPFSGGTPAEMLAQRIVRSPPSVASLRPDLPRFVVGLCDRLLDVRPAGRLPDAGAVVAAIDAQRLPRAPWRPTLNHGLAALLALVVLLLVVLPNSGWFGHDSGPVEATAPLSSRAALLVLPVAAPDTAADRALLDGLQRELSMRLQQAGVELIDPLRLDRARRELDITRQRIDDERERLAAALPVRRSLLLQWQDAPERAIVLRLEAEAPESSAWQQRLVLESPADLTAQLERIWQSLAAELAIGPLPTPFSDADELRRLAALDLQQDSTRVDFNAFGADTSSDRWWA